MGGILENDCLSSGPFRVDSRLHWGGCAHPDGRTVSAASGIEFHARDKRFWDGRVWDFLVWNLWARNPRCGQLLRPIAGSRDNRSIGYCAFLGATVRRVFDRRGIRERAVVSRFR